MVHIENEGNHHKIWPMWSNQNYKQNIHAYKFLEIFVSVLSFDLVKLFPILVYNYKYKQNQVCINFCIQIKTRDRSQTLTLVVEEVIVSDLNLTPRHN